MIPLHWLPRTWAIVVVGWGGAVAGVVACTAVLLERPRVGVVAGGLSLLAHVIVRTIDPPIDRR